MERTDRFFESYNKTKQTFPNPSPPSLGGEECREVLAALLFEKVR